MRSLFAFVAAVAALAPAAPARAQLIGQPGGASIASVVGLHAFAIVEAESMHAKQSFDAVLADSSKSTPVFVGGGVEVTRLWKGVFGRFTVSSSSNTGTRVFVDSDGRAFPLNVPVTIEIRPLEVGGGWRFEGNAQRRVSVVPYVGAAILLQGYKETSDGASAGEDTDTTDSGQTIFGGVEIGVSVLRLGAELLYRNVPNAIGAAGVSEDYDETNLGGTVVRFTIGVGF
jgi:hypothetical protein